MSHKIKARSFTNHSIGNRLEDGEPCCESPQIIERDGYTVCINCGSVIDRDYVSQGARLFAQEDVETKKQAESTWRNFGNRTIIDETKGDGQGRPLSGKARIYHRHLSKINRSIIKSIDRNFLEAKPILNKAATQLGLPPYIRDNAWRIYKEVADQRLTMGRSIRAFIAASIYVSCRLFGYPRILEDIAETMLVPMREIHNSLALIVRHVLPKLGLKFKPESALNLVYYIGNEIKAPTNIQLKAKQLLEAAMKKGLLTVGKDPKGLAAAALYMVAKRVGVPITQADLSKIAHVTPVTIRSRMKEIKQALARVR